MASVLDPAAMRKLAKTPAYFGNPWVFGRSITGRSVLSPSLWSSSPSCDGLLVARRLPRILPSFIGGAVVGLQPGERAVPSQNPYELELWFAEQWVRMMSRNVQAMEAEGADAAGPDLPPLHELGACPPPYGYRAEVKEAQAARWALLMAELQSSVEEGLVRAPREIPLPRGAWR